MALPFTSTPGPPAAKTEATFRVASTRLSRIRLRRSSVQRPPATGSPARFTQASQRESSSCQGPGTVGSPWIARVPAGRPAGAALRESATTSCPSAAREVARARPTSPVAPGDEDAHGHGIPFGNFTSASLLRT